MCPNHAVQLSFWVTLLPYLDSLLMLRQRSFSNKNEHQSLIMDWRLICTVATIAC